MKYLFLNVEWNHYIDDEGKMQDEILTLSSVQATTRFTKERKFFRIVRPMHIEKVSTLTLHYLKIDECCLEKANSFEYILNEFIEQLEEFELMVLWNQRTYEVFMEALKLYPITFPKQQVLILQELLSSIDTSYQGKYVALDKALRKYHVKYNYNLLHCQCYDVEYLKKLYCSAKYQYKLACKQNPERTPFILEKTNRYHGSNCPYTKGRTDEASKNSYYMNLFEGALLCQHCKRAGRFAIIPESVEFIRMDRTESMEAQIQKLCRKLHFQCYFSMDVIFIQSKLFSWRIYYQNNQVIKLEHENYRRNVRKFGKKKFHQGYHIQEIDSMSVYDTVWYIAKHDKAFFAAQNNSLHRVNELFKLIEQQN